MLQQQPAVVPLPQCLADNADSGEVFLLLCFELILRVGFLICLISTDLYSECSCFLGTSYSN